MECIIQVKEISIPNYWIVTVRNCQKRIVAQNWTYKYAIYKFQKDICKRHIINNHVLIVYSCGQILFTFYVQLIKSYPCLSFPYLQRKLDLEANCICLFWLSVFSCRMAIVGCVNISTDDATKYALQHNRFLISSLCSSNI